jgi:hypothetical protein
MPARRSTLALVSASDSALFPFLQGLVQSVRDHGPPGAYQLCVIDVGLTREERTWVDRHVDGVAEGRWDVDVPDQTPRAVQALLCRPFLPSYFPGHDVYLWVDADAWVQDWAAVDMFVAACEDGSIGVVPQVDRSYVYHYNISHARGWMYGCYEDGFGRSVADLLWWNPIVNSGVFSMRADSAGWSVWAHHLRYGVRRTRTAIDEASLNVAIYSRAMPARFLPPDTNWICNYARPRVDVVSNTLVHPMLPHEPLRIVHLAGEQPKRGPAELETTEGQRVSRWLTYRAAVVPTSDAAPAPAASSIHIAPSTLAVVSAADSSYFPLLRGLVQSVRESGPKGSYSLCVIDLGLEPSQRAWTERHVDHVVEGRWDLDFPGRASAPRRIQGLTCRPFLPTYFPGHDAYFWLDADAWVQDWSAVDLFVRACGDGSIGLVPEVDRAYRYHYNAGKPRMWMYRNYRSGFGEDVAKRLWWNPIISAGAFAMLAASEGWDAWAEHLSRGLARTVSSIDQTSLNVAVYSDAMPAAFLPAETHWLCNYATPRLDVTTGKLVHPMLPHAVLGILHLAGPFTKHQQTDVEASDGRTVRRWLTYRGEANGASIV